MSADAASPSGRASRSWIVISLVGLLVWAVLALSAAGTHSEAPPHGVPGTPLRLSAGQVQVIR